MIGRANTNHSMASTASPLARHCFTSGVGSAITLKGGVNARDYRERLVVRPFHTLVRRVCAPDGLPYALPKPPDDGLLVADRNGDPGLGLSHGSPARVLVGVKTQEG
jgi:hypothetical protein